MKTEIHNYLVSVILELSLFVSILYLLFQHNEIPWIGLTVAITFSVYGLIRKKINVDTDIGLLIETLLLSPFAVVAFLYLMKLNLNIFSCNEIGNIINGSGVSFILLSLIIQIFWIEELTKMPSSSLLFHGRMNAVTADITKAALAVGIGIAGGWLFYNSVI